MKSKYIRVAVILCLLIFAGINAYDARNIASDREAYYMLTWASLIFFWCGHEACRRDSNGQA